MLEQQSSDIGIMIKIFETSFLDLSWSLLGNCSYDEKISEDRRAAIGTQKTKEVKEQET